MSGALAAATAFESVAADRVRVIGPLDFDSVTPLLAVGSEAIEQGRATVVDLAGVTAADSAGLALLIEWLSVAKAAGRALRYENMPSQVHQLARLSEVEELLAPA